MENKILIGIIIICVALLAVGIIIHRFDLLVNMILRMVMGIVGIYLVNAFLSAQNIETLAGINGITVLIVGILGLPGFLLVYGIGVYHMFFG